MQSSRHHQNLFASQISEPRKSILPSFDDDNDSPLEPPSAYTLDFDFSEFDSHLFPSPQFETFLTGSYLEDDKKPANPPPSVDPEPAVPFPVPDVKLSSFAELEEDCSALQFDSEVIVLTRPRTPFNGTQSHSHFQTLALPSTSRRPPSPVQVVAPRTQSGIARKESKYQRNAPPHLHLKASNYDHYRRLSRRLSSRRDTRSSLGLVNDITSPVPTTQLIDSNPNTPKSFRAFRISYASSKSSKRGSRIHFSTKELHRRRILKLQRTFGERVPLELVAVSPARRRRRRSSRPFSVVSYRGPYALTNTFGGPINPAVGDWTLDRIGPPPPPVKPKSSCGIFRVSVVGESSNGNRRPMNTLRKSRMSVPRKAVEESFEVIEHEGPLEEGEEGYDRGDNSIWLDEDPPLPRGNQPWRSSRLVPAHEHETLAAIRAMGIFFGEPSNLVVDPVPSQSRPISDVSILDRYTSMAPSRSSSPSMPAFYHGSDSDHTHLQHQYQHLRRQQQQQQQQQQQPLPNTPAVSPALFWPRMPFSAPITEQAMNSAVSDDVPPDPYDLSLFEDVPNVVMSSRRSERRQGWSGEWNQPSIRDVIKKLRDI